MVSTRTKLLIAGTLAAALLARQAFKRKKDKVTDDQVRAKGSSHYWRKILNLLAVSKDPHALKLLAAMLGCAACFAVIDANKAKTGGELFRAVFLGKEADFRVLLVKNVGLSLALVCANKLLANLVSSLARHWHGKLVNAIHDQYFSGTNYYKIQQRVEFAHERICTDAQQLTRDLALVACDFVNATTNFSFFGSKLFFVVQNISGTGSAIQITFAPLAYALVAWSVISLVTPNFGYMRKMQRGLETAYRQAHLRFARQSEAVALYKGEAYEQSTLEKHFSDMCNFMDRVRMKRFYSEIWTQYMQKYCTHSVMLGLIMLPFFSSKRVDTPADTLLFQIRYLADLLYMEVLSLGSMARLLTTTKQVGGIVDRVGVLVEELEQCSYETQASHAIRMTSDNSIVFDKVSIVTPTGHKLVEDLSFTIRQGSSIIICGPNGSGKSSIFRCLGGLWPVAGGFVSRPSGDSVGLHSNVFYLPQKPYSVIGTLAQNVTYPNTNSKVEEEQLLAVLRLVELEHLYSQAKQQGTLGSTCNWEQRLSLGEQQRLAMARLFWQRPTFAILDECTSAVSLKMERRLFRICRQLGISLITISHRPALQEFHDRILTLDGSGGYTIRNLEHEHTDSNLPSNQSSADLLDVKSLSAGALPLNRIVSRLERSGSIAKLDELNVLKPKATTYLLNDCEQISKQQLKQTASWEFTMQLLTELAGLPDTRKLCAALLVVTILKTYLTNRIAHLNGHSMRLLMRGETSEFLKLLASAFGLGLAQAVLLPGLDALEETLAQLWRKWMTRELTERYLANKNYFRVANLERRNLNAGQVIVEDIDKLSGSIANLWTEAAKPLVDFLWFNAGVIRLTGFTGFSWLVIYMVGGVSVLKMIRPDLAGLTADKERLDGDFSQVHSRLAESAESVAFLDGGYAERKVIDDKFKAKLNHQRDQKRVEHMYGIADQFVSVFLPQNASWLLSMLYKQTWAEGRSDARLTHDLRYLGTVVSQSFSSLGTLVELTSKWASTRGHLDRVAQLVAALDTPLLADLPVGRHLTGEPTSITFEAVDVTTPDMQRLLVKRLSLNVDSADSRGLMIAGPNGSGKSAILRVISGVWAPGSGVVHSVPEHIHYVPTKPYTCEGNLADQVTYPFKATQSDAAEISQALQAVKVAYLADREGLFKKEISGWDLRLSLGEQQRIAIARLLFRASKWRWALLDECTSAVALDGEEEMYRRMTDLGISVVTATQKPWLLHFHDKLIQLNEDAAWEMQQIEKTAEKTSVRLPEYVYTDKRQSLQDTPKSPPSKSVSFAQES